MVVRIEICRSLLSDIHSYWVIKLTRKTDHTLWYEKQYKQIQLLKIFIDSYWNDVGIIRLLHSIIDKGTHYQ